MRLSLVVLSFAALLPVTRLQAQSVLMPEAEAPASTLRVTGEYLTWWIREGRIPTVLTTSPPASQGILGQPDTRVLYGDQRLETRHQDRFVGGRISADWMDGSGEFGVEGRAFFLERDSTYFKAVDTNGSKLLALSYVDAATGKEASRLVAGPDPQRGLLTGGFVGYSRIEWFGEEANFVLPLTRGEAWKVDLLAGARFFQMRDRYHFTATSRSYPDTAAHLYGLDDNYRVSTAFYGAQVGVRGEAEFGRFFVQARGTIALGGDDEKGTTFGESIDQTPAFRHATPVGLLIGPNNTADYSRWALDGVGEVGVNVGYQLNRRLRFTAGYTLIAWFDPLRAGDQIDRVANRPGFAFKGETTWVHGVSAGIEARW